MRAVLLVLAAGSVLPGCGAMMPDRTRPARVELTAEQGRWRVEFAAAELEMDGWSLRVSEATVNAVSRVPRLETLVLEIANTSDDEPLVLAPDEVYLADVDGGAMPLGPRERIVLEPGGSAVMSYDPGIRAPMLAYPFEVNATAFRTLDLTVERSARFYLY